MTSIQLEHAHRRSLREVGGKAQTLGWLLESGFSVPQGFVVSPNDSIDTDPFSGGVPIRPETTYAVRSSGWDEDGPDRSLAGQYESYLNVPVEDVALTVSKCRAAAMNKGSSGIPVIVQEMVPAKLAGVAFTADPVTGDRSTTSLSGVPGLADRLLSGTEAGDEWTVRNGRASADREPHGALHRSLVMEIADLAADIEDLMGEPVDVEWAWDGQRLWVVQARPITGLPPPVTWEAPAPGVFHRSFRFGEWIPEPISPLFESWLLTTMENRLHQVHRQQVGQRAPKPLHVVVNGWYFYSLNFLPVPGASLWRSLPGILQRLITHPKRVAVMFPPTVRFGYPQYERAWREDLLPRYLEATAEAKANLIDCQPRELVEIIDGLASLAGEYFASMTVVAGSAYKFETTLARFWARHLEDELGESHMTLLAGLYSPPITTEGVMVESLDWQRPPVEHDRAPLDPTTFDELRRRRERLEARVRSVLSRSPRKLRRFERLLADAQSLVPIRERQAAGLTTPWPVLRKAALRLGEHISAQQVIDRPEDVFFLRKPELLAALESPTPSQSLVERREAHLAAARRLQPPLQIGRPPMAVRVMFASTARSFGARPSKNALLNGVPASPGRATGRVRVIQRSEEFGRLQPGEILVAPITAPAWTPLFAKAGAVVTDVGSALAHASIIAREFGIPAVVGCETATSELRDGLLVTVDGSRGTVEPAIE